MKSNASSSLFIQLFISIELAIHFGYWTSCMNSFFHNFSTSTCNDAYRTLSKGQHFSLIGVYFKTNNDKLSRDQSQSYHHGTTRIHPDYSGGTPLIPLGLLKKSFRLITHFNKSFNNLCLLSFSSQIQLKLDFFFVVWSCFHNINIIFLSAKGFITVWFVYFQIISYNMIHEQFFKWLGFHKILLTKVPRTFGCNTRFQLLHNQCIFRLSLQRKALYYMNRRLGPTVPLGFFVNAEGTRNILGVNITINYHT